MKCSWINWNNHIKAEIYGSTFGKGIEIPNDIFDGAFDYEFMMFNSFVDAMDEI